METKAKSKPKTDTAVAVHDPVQIQLPPKEYVDPTPGQLLQIAIDKGVDIAQLEKLMDLQERWEKKEAQKKFFEALAQFQRNCPVITKNKKADFPLKSGGRMSYSYATLDEIIEQIKAPLADADLSYRFQTKEIGERLEVTCIITHKAGHSEVNAMSANADTSGTKNDIQARGSSISYLQRYTLIGSLGIATAQEDNDGAAAGTKKTDDGKSVTDQVKKDLATINSLPDLEKYWHGNKQLQTFAPFKTAVASRKEELKNAK